MGAATEYSWFSVIDAMDEENRSSSLWRVALADWCAVPRCNDGDESAVAAVSAVTGMRRDDDNDTTASSLVSTKISLTGMVSSKRLLSLISNSDFSPFIMFSG